MVDINEYLAALPGAKASNKIGETELNVIFLNSMPNIRSKKAYVQDFDCDSII